MASALYQELHRCFRYEDGKLHWRERPTKWPTARQGTEAGYIWTRPTDGTKRCVIRFQTKLYKRSRLVFYMHHDRWPEPTCDHRDRDSLNDRIENLREATYAIQSMNRGGHRGRALPKGILHRPHRNASKPYYVQIKHGGKHVEASYHPTLEVAIARADEVYAGLPC
jgi:hypothetical protein